MKAILTFVLLVWIQLNFWFCYDIDIALSVLFKYIIETSSSSDMRRRDWLPWPGEAQRREEKRAEARLAEDLQRLDQAKHYHLNTLNREQRRLHRDLISVKTGVWVITFL